MNHSINLDLKAMEMVLIQKLTNQQEPKYKEEFFGADKKSNAEDKQVDKLESKSTKMVLIQKLSNQQK